MAESIDHEYTDQVVCPHCGYTFSDSHEFFDYGEEDAEDLQCYGCEKTFNAALHISFSYSTRVRN